MAADVKMASVVALVVLDSGGKRVAAQYYTEALSEMKRQQALEAELHKKTSKIASRGDCEITFADTYITVFKVCNDVVLHVVISADANELLALSVLTCLEDAMGQLLRSPLDKTSLVNNLDLLLLAMDEIVDHGIIFETEAGLVASRVQMKGVENPAGADQSFMDAVQKARENLVRSFQ